MDMPPKERPRNPRQARAASTRIGRAIGRLLQAGYLPGPISVTLIVVGVLAIGVVILWLVSLVLLLAAEILGFICAIVVVVILAELVVALSAPDRSR
jgi:hypothetical protein